MPTPQHFTFATAALARTVAHGGPGNVAAARVLDRGTQPGCTFVDLVIVPPGSSIGRHRHGNEEEVYVIVAGTATMDVDGARFSVRSGDVVVNRPGGTHALDNDGTEPLRLVVVEVRT